MDLGLSDKTALPLSAGGGLPISNVLDVSGPAPSNAGLTFDERRDQEAVRSLQII